MSRAPISAVGSDGRLILPGAAHAGRARHRTQRAPGRCFLPGRCSPPGCRSLPGQAPGLIHRRTPFQDDAGGADAGERYRRRGRRTVLRPVGDLPVRARRRAEDHRRAQSWHVRTRRRARTRGRADPLWTPGEAGRGRRRRRGGRDQARRVPVRPHPLDHPLNPGGEGGADGADRGARRVYHRTRRAGARPAAGRRGSPIRAGRRGPPLHTARDRRIGPIR